MSLSGRQIAGGIIALFTVLFATTVYHELSADSAGAATPPAAAAPAAEESEQSAVDALLAKMDETGGGAAQRYFTVAVKTEDAIRSGELAAREADDAHDLVQRHHLPNATKSVQAVVDDIRQLSDKDVRTLLSRMPE